MNSLLELAFAQHRQGQLASAESLYRQILANDPSHVEASSLLGALRLQCGDAVEAERLLRFALTSDPSHRRSLENLAILMAQTHRDDEAAGLFRAVLAIDPRSLETAINLARHLGRKDRRQAIDLLDRQRAFHPDNARLYFELGNHWLALGDSNLAVEFFDRAVALAPSYAEAWLHRGGVLSQMRRFDLAERSYRRALMTRPGYAKAANNLGVLLTEEGRYDEAEAIFASQLDQPNPMPGLFSNRGLVDLGRGNIDAAMVWFEREIALHPDYAESHRNRAVAWLMAGDPRGWREFLWRWRCKDYPQHGLTMPLWDGEPLNGKSILLHAEQGMGDTIQFIRFAPRVKQQGGPVVVRCPRSLHRLLRGIDGVDQWIGLEDPVASCDVRAALMDLPAFFPDIPRATPYLCPEPDLVAQYRDQIATRPGLNVGIHWQGNPQYRGDRHRSMPLSHFRPIAEVLGCNLFSLQQGPGKEQLSANDFFVIDLGVVDRPEAAFVNTAAFMTCLDLVITSDTATAHLAGALGVHVWVALPFAPDWRWMLRRDDSPWYPTMKLYRQPTWGDWTTVFDRMAKDLRALCDLAAPASGW